MKFDDTGLNYGPVVFSFIELKRAVRPREFPAGKVRDRAKLLRYTLNGLADLLEKFAISKTPGLNQFLYQEFSGQSSLPAIRRFAALAAAAERAQASFAGGGVDASSASASGSGVSRRPNRNNSNNGNSNNNRQRNEGKRELADVQCYGCKKFGHYRHLCPEKKDKSSNNLENSHKTFLSRRQLSQGGCKFVENFFV